jgi:hypothetical protein
VVWLNGRVTVTHNNIFNKNLEERSLKLPKEMIDAMEKEMLNTLIWSLHFICMNIIIKMLWESQAEIRDTEAV